MNKESYKMNYKIISIEYYLPNHVIDNIYLIRELGIEKNFLEDKIGIKKRHIASPDDTASDMSVNAANDLIEKTKIDRNSIDLLIICTQNPDYKLPTTACILQDKLGLKNSCIAFDINLGCSGFIYSFVTAGSFIKTGMVNKAIIITVDLYSKLIDYTDKNTASIFGDAAAATLIEKCKEDSGVIDAVFGTDGSNADKLIAYNSGIKINSRKNNYLFMDGREIFKFSVQVVPASIHELLNRNNLKVSDIRLFILHQANKYMLTEIQKRLNISNEQMVIDLEDYGNTVSSTIPIAYKNILNKNILKKGDLVIFCGFGVGLSWGTILYRFELFE